MSVRLALHSERFSPTGSTSSTGIRNQLGRPRLELLTVVVRETVQNSWDARLPTEGRINYLIGARTLEDRQRDGLTRSVFAELPPSGLELGKVLESSEITVLEISDRRTTGLGGPTRADVVSDERMDFVNFFRNVGEPPDRRFGGGTFGFGKAVLYIASAARTIVVYTRCRMGNGIESRLMAAALGEQFTDTGRWKRRPFTGRHWWGRMAGDVVEPLRGRHADELAALLGMRGFRGSETGTDIMIVSPRFEDRSAEQAMHFIADTIAWNFWPRMIPDGSGHPAIDFAVSLDGKRIQIPDPASAPPLHGFVRALHSVHAVSEGGTPLPGWNVTEIRCERPRQRLGWLCLGRVAFRRRHERDETTQSDTAVEGHAHHVALMRQPRFVVKYIEGPESPVPAAEWMGVFLASPDADRAFATAEPPTHDDWAPRILERSPEKTFVNVALTRIRDLMREFMTPSQSDTTGDTVLPLGGLASELAGIIAGDAGPGAGIEPSEHRPPRLGGGGSARSRRPRVDVLPTHRLVVIEGGRAMVVDLDVTPVAGSAATRLTARADVATQDGSAVESDPPLGAPRPQVIQWQGPRNRIIRDAATIEIPANGPERWTVTVAIPDDTVVSLGVSGEAVAD